MSLLRRRAMMVDKSAEWEFIEEITNEDIIDKEVKSIIFKQMDGYNRFRVVCDFSVNGNTQCYISANRAYATAYHIGNIPYKPSGTRSLDVIIESYGEDDVHAYGTYSVRGDPSVEFDLYRTSQPRYPITEICVWALSASILAGGKFILYGQK